MAIGADSAIEFFGTQDDLDSSSATVTDTSFSLSSDLVEWTNDDDAPMAAITFDGTFASTADANSSVNLYAQLLNVADTTGDDNAPTSSFPHTYLGSFPITAATAHYVTIQIGLPNFKSSSEYQFYIENQGGQTISAGWTLHITPKAIGPHA